MLSGNTSSRTEPRMTNIAKKMADKDSGEKQDNTTQNHRIQGMVISLNFYLLLFMFIFRVL